MNSMKKEFLKSYNLPLSLRDDFLHSLEKVENEKVDITIGNHVDDVDVAGKYEKIKAGEKNPFIDSSAWRKRIEKYREAFDEMMAAGE